MLTIKPSSILTNPFLKPGNPLKQEIKATKRKKTRLVNSPLKIDPNHLIIKSPRTLSVLTRKKPKLNLTESKASSILRLECLRIEMGHPRENRYFDLYSLISRS